MIERFSDYNLVKAYLLFHSEELGQIVSISSLSSADLFAVLFILLFSVGQVFHLIGLQFLHM